MIKMFRNFYSELTNRSKCFWGFHKAESYKTWGYHWCKNCDSYCFDDDDKK